MPVSSLFVLKDSDVLSCFGC